MSIIRGARPDTGWYALDRRISEDERLSWAARGLLVFLLGKPDHWKVSVEHLRKQTAGARIRTGRDGIYALLRELQDTGYMTAKQTRSDAGVLGEMEYVVSELPPLPAEPYTGEPYTANTTLDKTDKTAKTEKSVSCRFEDFWRAYPVKKGKAQALSTWRRKKLDGIADQIIAHVHLMQAEDRGWREGFVPHGSTYINGARWQDEPVRGAVAGKTAQGLVALEGFRRGITGLDSGRGGEGLAALDGARAAVYPGIGLDRAHSADLGGGAAAQPHVGPGAGRAANPASLPDFGGHARSVATGEAFDCGDAGLPAGKVAVAGECG